MLPLRSGIILCRFFGSTSLSALLALLAALLTVGCTGDSSTAGSARQLKLLLDFAPNAIHTPIYAAIEHGEDRRVGIALKLLAPSPQADRIAALSSGHADLAIFDIHDLALVAQRQSSGRAGDQNNAAGRLVAVAAIIDEPLAALITGPQIRRPRELAGRRVGVSGIRSDDAVLRAIVGGDGGDVAAVRRTTIGGGAVPALLSGRVAAATAFWPIEGIRLEQRRSGFRSFRLTEYGAPRYPELVLVTTRSLLDRRRAEIGAAVAALRAGYELTRRDQAAALAALLRAEPTLDRRDSATQLAALKRSFTTGDRPYGTFDVDRLGRWARWEQAIGITGSRPPVERIFDLTVAEPPSARR